MSEQEIYSRLGKLEAGVTHLDKRLDTIDEKLDKHAELVSDIKHMKNNIKMMSGPVEDYQRVKQRGLGMWSVLLVIASGGTITLNVISYVIRVYVLKVGAP